MDSGTYIRSTYATLLDQQIAATAIVKEDLERARADSATFQQELAAAELDRDASQESADSWQDQYEDEKHNHLETLSQWGFNRDDFVEILYVLGYDEHGYDYEMQYGKDWDYLYATV